MKKYLVYALVLGVCAFFPTFANAGEVIGTPGQDQYTMGSLSVGLTGAPRPFSVRVPVNNMHALSVQNADNTAECVTFTVDASGRGLLRIRDRFNAVQAEFWAGNQNYVLQRFGVGTAAPTAKLDVVGDIKSSTTITAGTDLSAAVVEIRGSGNDVAETFKVNAEHVEPGMVVSIDPKNPGELTLCSEANDRKVAGIISGAGDLHTGIHLGDIPNTEAGEQAVALTGRVWCWVDTAMTGPVNPGDSLTTSTTPGHAMKVLDYNLSQGAMIGKAMTSLESGRGLVLVLVSLQ